jgi:hypothetical protein|nr:MAG TPA: hypothetical protein [Caudoviricetes sp.]
MKIYELCEVNADWKYDTVLSIQTTRGTINIGCLAMFESDIRVNGKYIPCLEVKWFSGNEIIAW